MINILYPYVCFASSYIYDPINEWLDVNASNRSVKIEHIKELTSLGCLKASRSKNGEVKYEISSQCLIQITGITSIAER